MAHTGCQDRWASSQMFCSRLQPWIRPLSNEPLDHAHVTTEGGRVQDRDARVRRCIDRDVEAAHEPLQKLEPALCRGHVARHKALVVCLQGVAALLDEEGRRLLAAVQTAGHVQQALFKGQGP